MQAAEEPELKNDDPATPWWERAPFGGATSFSSVLSAAAVPARQGAHPTPGGEDARWGRSEFADAGDGVGMDMGADMGLDTASISYESALRAAIRFPAAEMDGGAAQEAARAGPEPDEPEERGPEEAEPGAAGLPIAAEGLAESRTASVTVRLSAAEWAQLKQRAAEARLTVSAYIRSCTFEAEALRAQVKQALKELRGQLQGELHGGDPGKKPPAREYAARDAPREESPRRWWRLRLQERNQSVQA